MGDEAPNTEREPQPAPAAPTADSGMSDLLETAGQRYKTLRRGEVVDGVVVHVDRDEVLVDIGGKSEAIIPGSEIGAPGGDVHAYLKPGDQIVAYVLQPEDPEGKAVLSLARARVERGWRSIQRLYEEAQTIEAEVVEHNKGGLIVNVEGVRGFVPLSQIVDLRQAGQTEEAVEQRLASMRGKKLLLKVIELNRRRNRLILSERAAIQERRLREKDRLLSELQEGEVRHGRVSSICDFGAFVDLGGADGLIHLSELSWGQVSHPSQVLKEGDEVDVLVVGVDREKKKIALSLKRLQPEPWTLVAEKYHIGQLVKGRITKLATFGAFAEIENGIEGLIHISELADERIAHPRNVVREGDELLLRVIKIDPQRRRLGLSLRQAQDEAEEYAPVAARPEEGTAVTAMAMAFAEAERGGEGESTE